MGDLVFDFFVVGDVVSAGVGPVAGETHRILGDQFVRVAN